MNRTNNCLRRLSSAALVAGTLVGVSLSAWGDDAGTSGLRMSGVVSGAGRISLGERALTLRDASGAGDPWPVIWWTLRYDGLLLRSHAAAIVEGPVVQRAALSSVYFSRLGGLRATGGVLGLTRIEAVRMLPAASAPGQYGTTERLAASWSGEGTLNLPYIGVGYSNRWLTGPSAGLTTLGISADFGLMAANPRSAVRLGPQALDDTMRDLRLAPMLQLGVSYTY
ncbi:MAG: hypothetical protein RIQ60_2477 [Pseudomonadota bacterium]|jgi:hypothetical protein